MNILKEEDYLNEISSIIESDYFPDKKKLNLMSTLLDAKDSGNTTILQATEEILESLPSESSTKLDLFLAKNTSEDNISFQKIQEQASKNFNEKFWWITSTPKGLEYTSKKDSFNALMFMKTPLEINTQDFKKPKKQIIKANTRLSEITAKEKGYSMPEPSEKEILARKIIEQSIRQSEKSSRFSTPKTPSSRVSSIFPIYNINLPTKRNRN
ncbi:hypothetical protein SteCoe_7086 [Stentor coeruleus]|uniref:Uncharacterized protein n=1 Tax=Stentor coeruleus TaxID=5963 RepID=A0A1R2CNA8_9CILI|nr:hypothetical protein SteCoe_7086 [Stentor coeruleus]